MSRPRQVHVVRTGTANLASVLTALRRLDAEPVVTTDAQAVATASHVIVPGVGAFAAGMSGLAAHGLVDPLYQRVHDGQRATLGVCLGMQLFCQGSDESPDAMGMGAVHGVVQRFVAKPDVRVPQLGWNEVRPQSGCHVVTPGYAYFAHSYRVVEVPAGWQGALADHGGLFVAALERGPIVLCQFHPELSGAYGAALLRRWLEG